jgi:primase-polymerase (primpol)-like protein
VTGKPTRPVPDLPAELTAVPQWLLWRREDRHGRPTKVPYAAATGRRTDVTDPAAWATFAAARAALAAGRGRYAGLGFAFAAGGPLCGIDLDDAFGPAGTLLPWAAGIVAQLDTYAEVSPSGRGVKLVCRGQLRPGLDGRTRHKRVGVGPDGTGSVELYDGRRFFTLTGRTVPGCPGPLPVAARQRPLDALCHKLFPPPRPPAAVRRPWRAQAGCRDDSAVLARAAAAGGPRFERLWAGDAAAHGGDRSARDAALCASLARHTRDPDQIARLVGRSGCDRPKWADRPDYRDRTIRFALRIVGP